LNNCKPSNIIQELEKITSEAKMDKVKAERNQMVARVEVLINEQADRDKEIRKFYLE